jgi:hypothetical protein
MTGLETAPKNNMYQYAQGWKASLMPTKWIGWNEGRIIGTWLKKQEYAESLNDKECIEFLQSGLTPAMWEAIQSPKEEITL